jgi:flagellar biosynthesis/type III secretory pathway ATPase
VIPKWYHVFMAMTLRLTAEQEAQLTALAQQTNMSKQQAAVMAIEEAAQRRAYDAKLDSAIDSVLTRYADALERLGK